MQYVCVALSGAVSVTTCVAVLTLGSPDRFEVTLRDCQAATRGCRVRNRDTAVNDMRVEHNRVGHPWIFSGRQVQVEAFPQEKMAHRSIREMEEERLQYVLQHGKIHVVMK